MARGCAILGVIVVLLVCCGLIASVALYVATDPNSIRVQTLIMPQTVAVGDTFTVEVTIENVDLSAVTITGIGLSENILTGAVVQSSDPAYGTIKNYDYPVLGTWDEYTGNWSLAGGRELVLTFTLLAVQPGSYSGDVTVWIDSKLLGLVSLDRAGRASIRFEVQ